MMNDSSFSLKYFFLFFFCFAGLLLVSACGKTPATTGDAPDLIECTDPRPQVCTQQYDPVCGRLRSGATKTYAGGCMACSDAEVTGYLPGGCDE